MLAVSVEVRRLQEDELQRAYALIHQLRTDLTAEEFRVRIARQTTHGYTLLGAFSGDRLVGLLGMRPVETLARGRHLHVDDLVVDETVRRRGIGRALVDFAERDAFERGLVSVFLDSRTDVVPFYERLRYSGHAAILMRKRLVKNNF